MAAKSKTILGTLSHPEKVFRPFFENRQAIPKAVARLKKI